MTTWNNCVKIYADGDFLDLEEDISFDEIMRSVQAYTNLIGKDPCETVWLDMDQKIPFGSEITFYLNPGEFSFFCSPGSLKEDRVWGVDNFCEKMNFENSDITTLNDQEIIYPSYLGLGDKYKDKKILVVGAGPSCLDVEWENNIEEYDYVWSCNNFFKYDFPKGVDLCFLGPTVDIRDETFLPYVQKHKTTVILEGGVTPYRDKSEVDFLKSSLKDKLGWIQSRYFSKLGAATRLIVLACALKAKSVSFIGVDGDLSKTEHAFEPGKNDASAKQYHLFKRQYVLFWEYLTKNTNTDIINLGEGHPANMSTDISRKLKS